MANQNDFEKTVQSLFDGMNGFIASKTVVGDPISVGDTIILPLVDVSFAMGAGAAGGDSKNKGSGAMGGKVSPSAVLVIRNGSTKLVNIKNQDAVTKILDLVPDMVNKFTGNSGLNDEEQEAVDHVFEADPEIIDEI